MARDNAGGWLGTAGVIALAAAVAATLIFGLWQLMASRQVNALPQITTQGQLQEALRGEPTAYRIIGATITGEPMADPLGLLGGGYLYLRTQEQTSTEKIRRDSDGREHRSLSWETTREQESCATLLLYGVVPLEGDFAVDTQGTLTLTPDVMTPEAAPQVQPGDKAYYPGSRGSAVGTERVRFFAAAPGETASLTATVGNGRAVAFAPAGAEPAVIFGGGAQELAQSTAGRFTPWLILIWVAAGVVVLYRWLTRAR